MISKDKTKSVIGATALKIMGWQLMVNIILWILFSEFRRYQINRNFNYINKYVSRDNIDLILVKESFKIEKSNIENMILISLAIIINIILIYYFSKILDRKESNLRSRKKK